MKKTKFYGMKNDYMFRAVLQESPEALKKLVCALLHVEEEEATDVKLVNPIELGKSITEKDCVLDIKVELNKNKLINIELQIRRQAFWPERSLLYWSRNYDHLEAGRGYGDLRETCHIGILNFTLFPETPEFYSEYRLLNCRTQRCYTDKLCIRVLDLTQIDNADEGTDKELIKWARIINADSLEELEKLTEEEEVYRKMTVKIRELSDEEKIRQQCDARFFYECDLASTRAEGVQEGILIGEERAMKRSEEEIKALKKRNQELEEALARLQNP